jgi:hypothetical protein
MEIYAIYNWGVSPFNDELGADDDFVFLQVLLDPTIQTLNPKTETDQYILCSFPFKAIQAAFPYKTVEITVNQEEIKKGEIVIQEKKELRGNMIVNKVILDDDIDGKVVKTEGGLTIFNIPSTDLTDGGIKKWLLEPLRANANLKLADVNITVSRDPMSCQILKPITI